MAGSGELRIDRLTLRLPAELEGRAHSLGHLLIRQLEALSLPPGRVELARLGVEAIRLEPGAGDLALARGMARAVEARLMRAAAGRGAPMRQAASAGQGARTGQGDPTGQEASRGRGMPMRQQSSVGPAGAASRPGPSGGAARGAHA